MPIQNNSRTIAVMAILLVGVAATAAVAVQLVNTPPPDLPTLDVTLLANAGVMIETSDTRIYIDPYLLNSTFADYPADIVLVTHPHGDHYDPTSLDIIETESTEFIFPADMSAECATYGATGVVPGDTVMIGNINVTAFYMYTLDVEIDSTIYLASHPIEANWTSFIVTIDGFTIFHSGDSKNILEYYDLTGTIDLAFLPLGPGCQTMAGYEVVQALERIQPTYFIPIHYGEGVQVTWLASYGDDVEENTDCTPIVLDYWTKHTFEL